MGIQSNFHFLRNLVYRLKRQYPGIIDIYSPTSLTLDTGTGRQVKTFSVQRVIKAIVLPSQFDSMVKFAASMTQGNKMGGAFDLVLQDFLIDAKDLPKGFLLTLEQYIVSDHNRFEVKQIRILGPKIAYVVTGAQTKIVSPFEINMLLCKDIVSFTDTIGESL